MYTRTVRVMRDIAEYTVYTLWVYNVYIYRIYCIYCIYIFSKNLLVVYCKSCLLIGYLPIDSEYGNGG